MCSGNDCCPRSTFGQTFPCPSADPTADSQCESPVKQTDCLAQACCLGQTANCLACAAGTSVEQYCLDNPGTAGCPAQACCEAYNAECNACSAGLSVEDYCAENPDISGCSTLLQVSAEDQVCSIGDHVECPGSGTMCSGNDCCPRSTFGQTFPCPSADPTADSQCESPVKQTDCLAQACCLGQTADCLACAAGTSVEQYCVDNPGTAGCPVPQICCLAFHADCFACEEGVSVGEYCAENPDIPGC